MALSAKLELRQSQTLVMTPQLQQAIKLLQLSNLELTAFVEAELERNPLLEREDGAADEAPIEHARDTNEPLSEAPGDAALADLPVAARIDDLDTDASNVDPDATAGDLSGFSGLGSSAATNRGFDGGDDDVNLEEFVATERTLQDHLIDQLSVAIFDPTRRFIGMNLVDMVDDAGYLRGDLDALAERLNAPLALVEETLTVLQTFDPCGVFARNLAECLSLQLKEQNRYDPLIASVLDNLQLIAQHDLAKLKRVCGIDQVELNDIIAEIRRLDPKPGLRFGRSLVQTVVPDVIVWPRKDGAWHVELNSETLPRVLVNQVYYSTVTRSARSSQEKTYLQDCLQTANWLVRSLDQRARTILKVADEIVRQQDGFLSYGIQHLRPLNLKTVADAIGMHESTVSRVTANKYMATNRGTFELKFFFTSAIASAGTGEAHSSESVRHRIKKLVDAETPHDVLSDDKIVAKLHADGIDIARRTVAKYREALHIASSVQRRREKRMREHVGA